MLPTAVLSAHTAFEGFRYEPLSLTPVADHWQQLGLQFDMIYTGYLGGRAQVDQALDYKPKSCLIRLIIKLIKKGVPVKRVNLIYLAYRKLYTLLISAPSAVS